MQDKHVVVFQKNEDREKFINKIEYSKTIYHIGGENPEPGDICCSARQSIDWIIAQYIVDNYDNLHDYTIFTQANPDDHVHEMLLAIKSTFKAGYGNFAYARSIYNQYSTDWVRWQPISLAAEMLGLGFINDTNVLKSIFILHPGCIFYVHKDRIRQRPKSFYQKMIDLDDDKSFFEYHWNYNHPKWVWDLLKKDKTVSNLSKKEQIQHKSYKSERDQFWGLALEPLWYYILADKQFFKKLNNAQATIGNKLYFNLNKDNFDTNYKFISHPYSYDMHQTLNNYRLLENDWFDWNCEHYQAWRNSLIENTIYEGNLRGFNGLELVNYYENIGYKHISL